MLLCNNIFKNMLLKSMKQSLLQAEKQFKLGKNSVHQTGNVKQENVKSQVQIDSGNGVYFIVIMKKIPLSNGNSSHVLWTPLLKWE